MLARVNTSCSSQQVRFLGAPLVARTSVARCNASVRPQASAGESKEVAKFAAASAVAATFLSSGNALAVQEVAQVADGDNRLGALLLLFVPALGWVLFNIAGPASRQLDDMSGKKSVIAGLGLGAAGLLAAQNAEAAEVVSTLAAGDNRLGALLFLLAPALGWVLFNIGGPASRQIETMSGKKSVIAGLGLGAAGLLAAQNAEAAEVVSTLAAGDNRLGALLFLLVPALGWVLFNIAGPASRQIDDMSGKKSVIAGLGLGAAGLLAAQNAEAAEVVSTLAAGDNRLGALLFLLAPALGWVLFNIGGPASRQIETMSKK